MRKKLIVFLFIIGSIAWKGFCAPAYGTKLPDKNRFFGGAETHVIFDKELKGDFGNVRSVQHFLLLSYGLRDWLTIDLKGGAGNIKQHPAASDEIDYSSSFAGGYGLRLRLYDCDDTKVVFGFHHISVHPRITHIEGVKHQAVLDDWQVSLLASYDFEKITPYAGARWTRIDYIHWVEEDRKREMSNTSKAIGLVAGFNLPVNEQTWINIEGQFLDSGEAAALSVNFSF